MTPTFPVHFCRISRDGMFPSRENLQPYYYPNACQPQRQQQPSANNTASQHSHTFQPLYVIPIAPAPITTTEPTVFDLTKRLDSSCAQVIAPKFDARPSSSHQQPRPRRPLATIDERELKRRVKKQNMERRRRACISDKLSALHGLAVSLIGDKPQTQIQQRTEITDILNQCVSVFQGLSEFVKNEPELQAKMHSLRKPLNIKTCEQPKTQTAISECEKENNMNTLSTTRASAFSPVSYHNSFTSTPLVPRVDPLRESNWTSHIYLQSRKRKNTDSGFCALSDFSASKSSRICSPSTSQDIEDLSLKQPKQQSGLWRPYLD